MQLLIKLLHRSSKPLDPPSSPTHKAEQSSWMPRFNYSFQRKNLPELLENRKRGLTHNPKTDFELFRENKPHRITSNSTQKSRNKLTHQLTIATPIPSSLNSLHLGFISNKNQRVATISYDLEQKSEKRIFSRRKNFFALKREAIVRSPANRGSSDDHRGKNTAKSKILKLVGKKCMTKGQGNNAQSFFSEKEEP